MKALTVTIKAGEVSLSKKIECTPSQVKAIWELADLFNLDESNKVAIYVEEVE